VAGVWVHSENNLIGKIFVGDFDAIPCAIENQCFQLEMK
jgi:hypothetical protein